MMLAFFLSLSFFQCTLYVKLVKDGALSHPDASACARFDHCDRGAATKNHRISAPPEITVTKRAERNNVECTQIGSVFSDDSLDSENVKDVLPEKRGKPNRFARYADNGIIVRRRNATRDDQ